MRRTIPVRWAAPVAGALAALLVASGCGTSDTSAADPEPVESGSATGEAEEPDAATDADTSAGEGTWLLGITTAGGADAETSTTVYLAYNPSTGQTTTHEMPGVRAGSASPEDAALLVSTDRQWAIPDTEIPRDRERSGKVEVHSLADGSTETIDLRERTGKADVKPVAWAFDPDRPATLRVVDTENRVWAVDVSGTDAPQESTLPTGPWVFTNGFDTNTGEPWVESIESDETRPSGQGPSNDDPVIRGGGDVLPAGDPAFADLPDIPCRLGAGYAEDGGVTWAFCADGAEITTHYLAPGASEWKAYGKPSSAVAPDVAGFPLVLPPL